MLTDICPPAPPPAPPVLPSAPQPAPNAASAVDLYTLLFGAPGSNPARPLLLAALPLTLNAADFLATCTYWTLAQGSPFLCFNAPCADAAYQPDTSWQERLGLGERALARARAAVATRNGTGHLLRATLASEALTSLILYWTDSARRTWYEVNLLLLCQKLSAALGLTVTVGKRPPAQPSSVAPPPSKFGARGVGRHIPAPAIPNPTSQSSPPTAEDEGVATRRALPPREAQSALLAAPLPVSLRASPLRPPAPTHVGEGARAIQDDGREGGPLGNLYDAGFLEKPASGSLPGKATERRFSLTTFKKEEEAIDSRVEQILRRMVQRLVARGVYEEPARRIAARAQEAGLRAGEVVALLDEHLAQLTGQKTPTEALAIAVWRLEHQPLRGATGRGIARTGQPSGDARKERRSPPPPLHGRGISSDAARRQRHIEEYEIGEETGRGAELPLAGESQARSPEATQRTLWDSVLAELRLQMTRATFERWVKDTRLIRVEQNCYTIAAPSPQAVEWLTHRLARVIEATVTRAAGQAVRLVFTSEGV